MNGDLANLTGETLTIIFVNYPYHQINKGGISNSMTSKKARVIIQGKQDGKLYVPKFCPNAFCPQPFKLAKF
jgi:hypothetical protein